MVGTVYFDKYVSPMGVALVLIYPCGKAQNSPPGGALKEGRRTYVQAVYSGPPLFLLAGE